MENQLKTNLKRNLKKINDWMVKFFKIDLIRTNELLVTYQALILLIKNGLQIDKLFFNDV